MVRISHDHYLSFCQFLEQQCGIVLGDNRQYLVSSRLGPLLARQKIDSLDALLQQLKLAGNGQLRSQVIEAMTTNETQFFRDSYPFEAMKRVLLPEFQRARGGHVRVWSAGCSSGQEAYSVIMAAQEYNADGGYISVQVVGTDISQTMIQEATAGRYTMSALSRGLDQQRLKRFFVPIDAQTWQVREDIRSRVSFRQHNLLDSYALLGRFDLILCRNVLIYFSQASRQDILRRLAKTLNPGGYLILGSSESVSRQVDCFELVRTPYGVVYRLR